MAQEDRTLGLVGFTGMKVPVRATTTANLTLSGEQTVDGVALVTGDRILVKNQTDTVDGGIYVVDSGDWERAEDCAGSYNLRKGSLVYVTDGTLYADSLWACTAANPVDIGTDSITFGQLTAALTGVSAYIETLFPAANAAAARTTLGVPAIASALNPDFSLLTAEASPDIADLLALYDASAATTDKITLANLFKVITGLTAEASPAVDDELVLYDTSGSTADKITLANLLKVINGLTADATPDRAADYVPTYDASTGLAKKVLLSDLPQGWKKVVDWTVVAAAATQPIVFTAYATAKRIRIEMVAGSVSVDGSYLRARTSTDAGATYDSAAGNYGYAFGAQSSSPAGLSAGVNAQTFIQMTSATAGELIGSAAAEGFSGEIIIWNPSDTTHDKLISFEFSYKTNTGAVNHVFVKGSGYRLTTADVDAIQLTTDTGNVGFTYAVFAEY